MRYVFTFVIIVLYTGLRAQADGYDIAQAEKKESLQMKSLKNAGADDNCNIIYQRLELNVNPNINYISGKVTTYFIPANAISYIEFDLHDTLSVDSILFHGHPASFSHTADVIHIFFPGSVEARAVDSVSVYYQGTPSSAGFGSFVQSKHNGVPIIWTLSEPYGAKDWWPCKQGLQDKIDSLDVLVTTPDSFTVAGNGLLVEEIQVGNNKTYHWKHRYPIATYLVCLAVTNYAAYYHYVPFGNDTLPVLNYIYPEDSAVLRPQTELVVPMMQLYDSLFGLYPFSKEKYGQVEFGWNGGMEHQTMTFLGNFGFETIAHELAHHWFGDKVTCASWGDIWLNEGFAVYLSGLCYEHIAPIWWIPFKQSRIGGSVVEPSGALYCYDTSDVTHIFDGHLAYSKGAMVLHMLRWELGDSLFFAGIRSYLYDAANAYSFASTSDLKNHLSATSGHDLNDFFSQWVYGKGFPSYQITWVQDFSNHVNITLGQTQSDPSVAFFEMPVAIKLKSAMRDTTMVFTHTYSGQPFSFDLPFAADSLIFDPDFWLISTNNTIIRQSAYPLAVRVFPDPVTNVLQVNVESTNQQKATVRIFNDLGQIQLNTTCNLQAGGNLLNFDVSKFASGIYRVNVSGAIRNVTAAFVVVGAK